MRLESFVLIQVILVALAAEVISKSINTESTISKDEEWWKNAVVYQIYPKSFMDGDGDGTGDLKGIKSRLDHLKEAGITALWLSPIYKSPNVDQGYDIQDFTDIDEIYGSLSDFKDLLTKAKELGIRVLLDFVPNHSSDKHIWFQLSQKKVPGYENYYIWSDNPKGKLPNNWISSFRGSAWTWSETRGAYYYHAFHEKQPDLNYRDPRVVKEMKQVLTFWMDLGVDGFRMDAVPYLFENLEMGDEPTLSGRTYDIDDETSLNHIYTKDQDETFDMIYQFREHLENYVKTHNTSRKLIMTEAYSSIENTMKYYGNENLTRLGAHFPFNFNFIQNLKEGFTPSDIVFSIHNWLDHVPKHVTSNWVLGNHDNHRVGSRLGKENIDGLNMLTSFLPGAMVTYYGEEIGMMDVDVTCEEGKDMQAKAGNCSKFLQTSRDFERTPFQWNSTKNSGFSSASKTWLPIAKDYQQVNLDVQRQSNGQCHYKLYRNAVQFKNRFLGRSSERDVVVAAEVVDGVLEVLRQRDEGEYVMLFNVGSTLKHVNFLRSKEHYRIEVVSGNNSKRNHVGKLLRDKIDLQPHECVILVHIMGDKEASSNF